MQKYILQRGVGSEGEGLGISKKHRMKTTTFLWLTVLFEIFAASLNRNPEALRNFTLLLKDFSSSYCGNVYYMLLFWALVGATGGI